MITTLAIFLTSTLAAKDGDPKTRLQEITTLQYSAAIVLLALCIIISSTNLIRIIRRMYQLKRDSKEQQRTSSISRENEPLIEHNDDGDSTEHLNQISINSAVSGKLFLTAKCTIVIFLVETLALEIDTQLFRHAILVGLLNINAFVVSRMANQLYTLLFHCFYISVYQFYSGRLQSPIMMVFTMNYNFWIQPYCTVK